MTDADLLRVTARGTNGDNAEFEKFLFYRGVGDFTAPLTVTQSADGDSFVLQNTGKEPLGNPTTRATWATAGSWNRPCAGSR